MANFEEHLLPPEREGIRQSVAQGIEDIEAGRFDEYDAAGLRGVAGELVAQSAKKQAARSKAK